MSDIAAGRLPSDDERLMWLVEATAQGRVEVNAALARAFYQRQDHTRARVHAERAWLLGARDRITAEIAASLMIARGEDDRAMGIFRDFVVAAERDGRINDLLLMFCSYRLHFGDNSDQYVSDTVIRDCVDRTYGPHRMTHPPAPAPLGRRIRIAHVLWGRGNSNVFVANLFFARGYDRDRFEVTFIILCGRDVLHVDADIARIHAASRDIGVRWLFLDLDGDGAGDAFEQIAKYGFDVIVFNTQLDLYYVIASLHLAPLQVGMIWGNPRAYASHHLDVAFCFSLQAAMEASCEALLVSGSLDLVRTANSLPPPAQVPAEMPPDGAFVLMTVGRHYKFDSPAYWDVMRRVLAARPQAHLVVVGATAAEVPQLAGLGDLARRVHCLGWRSDVQALVGRAHLYVDSFPYGGGWTVYEALMSSVAAVSPANEYDQLFDQRNWSPALEILDIPGAVLPRGDVQAMADGIIGLIDDGDARQAIIAAGAREIAALPSGAELISYCQEIYIARLAAKGFRYDFGAEAVSS